MARSSRWRMLWSALGVLGLFLPASVRAQTFPRVRSTDPVIAHALADAAARSSTFRSLVQTIEGTDGIVYVERGHCGHGVHACLMLSVVAGEGFRLLRILVDALEVGTALMSSLGHELQHAVELLAQPGVRTSAAAYLYYAREAPSAKDTFSAFETIAATRIGLQVERELH